MQLMLVYMSAAFCSVYILLKHIKNVCKLIQLIHILLNNISQFSVKIKIVFVEIFRCILYVSQPYQSVWAYNKLK